LDRTVCIPSELAFVVWSLFVGAAFVFYAIALQRLQLNIAHPILTTGSVALFSWFIFQEEFHLTTVVGIAFVLVGVALISSKVV